MVNICCTSKLLKRTGFSVASSMSEPTTALGNWYANILFFSHLQLLLFVSENSRLAVVTPAREIKSLPNHLIHHLSALLERLDAPPQWIEAEVREMTDARIAKTHSKSVLGTMNDYDFQIEVMIQRSGIVDPLEMAINLSVCPIGPLQYQNPHEVSFELLKRRYSAG